MLIPDIILKSDILEGLDREFEQVAKAIIKRHLCLQTLGWKINLKYKLSNYSTHLRKLGCPEVIVNALKHKSDGKQSPAYNVKKPKKGEVDPGENDQNLEIARV